MDNIARRQPGVTDERHAFRDRLTGRTPRSERGDRGSTPCPGADLAAVRMTPACRPVGSDGRAGNPRLLTAASQATPYGRVAQWKSACLTNKRLLVRAQPRPLGG